MDGRVQHCIKEMRFKGAVVNTAIIMACAEGVVMHHDSNFLAINSGHILQSVRTGQNLCCVEWGMLRKG